MVTDFLSARSNSLPNLNCHAIDYKLYYELEVKEMQLLISEHEQKLQVYKDQVRELADENARLRRREQVRSSKLKSFCVIQ